MLDAIRPSARKRERPSIVAAIVAAIKAVAGVVDIVILKVIGIEGIVGRVGIEQPLAALFGRTRAGIAADIIAAAAPREIVDARTGGAAAPSRARAGTCARRRIGNAVTGVGGSHHRTDAAKE